MHMSCTFGAAVGAVGPQPDRRQSRPFSSGGLARAAGMSDPKPDDKKAEEKKKADKKKKEEEDDLSDEDKELQVCSAAALPRSTRPVLVATAYSAADAHVVRAPRAGPNGAARHTYGATPCRHAGRY